MGGITIGAATVVAFTVIHSPFTPLPASDEARYGLPLAGVYTDAKQ